MNWPTRRIKTRAPGEETAQTATTPTFAQETWGTTAYEEGSRTRIPMRKYETRGARGSVNLWEQRFGSKTLGKELVAHCFTANVLLPLYLSKTLDSYDVKIPSRRILLLCFTDIFCVAVYTPLYVDLRWPYYHRSLLYFCLSFRFLIPDVFVLVHLLRMAFIGRRLTLHT